MVFLQHFRGNVDNWDPGSSTRWPPSGTSCWSTSVVWAARRGRRRTTSGRWRPTRSRSSAALDLARVDLFGYSLGGFVAQEVALTRPALVRRLVLAGTGPKGAPGMERWSDAVVAAVVADETGPAGVLHVFYAPTGTSQQAGQESLARIYGWQGDRDAPVTLATKDAQYEAVLRWGKQDWDEVQRLLRITQPTLVLQGDDDIMIPTRASHTLAGLIPDARITIYPDASHGSIFQHADEVARETLAFLGA